MAEESIIRTDNIELREELLDLMRQSHPKGNAEAQKSFCFSLDHSRIQVYMDTFREMVGHKR